MEKCKCLTAKGDRCSRLGKPEYHGYCFQHKACKTPVKVFHAKPKVKKPTKVDKKKPTKVDNDEHKGRLENWQRLKILRKE